MTKQNNWHYARPDLAQKYLDLFELGLTSARGLFARRRMGKTEFLKKDFIPAAQKSGYVVVYSNLWELEIDPSTALISEFYKMVEPKGFSKIWSSLNRPINIKKIKASGKMPGVDEGLIEADLSEAKRVSGTLLMEAMDAFDKTKYNMILVIDEALESFTQLKNTPEFFRRFIEYYLSNPESGSNAALEYTKSRVFSDKNFKRQWESLLPSDKVVLSMIAQGAGDLHGQVSMQKIGEALGIGTKVNKNTTHNALRRLAKKNLITKVDYGTYQFEDEAFQDWVKYLEV